MSAEAQDEHVDYEEEKDAETQQDAPVVAEGADAAEQPAPPSGDAAPADAAPAAGATAWVDPSTLPSHWSEVFIGNIAKTATEQDVRAFCEPVGPVHSLHLIPDPANPGQNKGFGFVRFATKKAAATALETLSGKELGAYPGRRLRVSPSQSKHKLYLGNIPRDAVRDDLQERLQQAAPGLESIEWTNDKDNPGNNRGFCFLDYRNQQCAQHALKILKDFRYNNRTLNASFSERASDDVSNRVDIKSVYVGNLPVGADEDGLRELFSAHGQVVKVIIPQPRPGKDHSEYGFVHFESHSAAVGVWEASETTELSLKGNKLTINLAKASTSRQPGDRNQAYDNRSQQFGERRTSAGGRDVGRAPAADAAGGAYGVYGGAVAAGGAVGIGAVGAGSILVPTMLPNGQMAYVLTATAAPGAVYDQGGRGGPVRRGDDRQGRGRGGVGRGDRYRPY